MGILGNYLPNWLPEDPNKNAAARQGLLAAGAALLGGRGDLGGILGDGLMAGTQGYHGALAQQQRSELAAAQMKHIGLQNQDLEASIAKPGRIAASIARARQPGAAAAGGGASVPSILPRNDLPQIGQVAASAAPEASYATRAAAVAPQDWFNFYRQNGDALAADGFMAEAKQQYDLAEKLRPKLKEQRALTVDGKRVMANVFDDGTTRQVDGFAPDAEKLSFQNTGGATVALDPFTGKPVNTIKNTVSPDAQLGADTARRGQNMADQRARDAAEAGRSQIVQSDEGPVLVNTKTGTGHAITAPDGQRLAGVSKPLNDAQSKALLFGSRMQEANKIMASLQAEGTTSSIPGSRAPVIGGIINAFSSDNRQMLDQAKRDFLTATLRRESGAVISDGEMVNGDKQYFPQIGDSEAVIAQKARNRELAIRGVLAEVPEKKRQSIVPVAELPKKAAPPQAYADPGKEQRYQEWKRSQGK